jgi:hypothetical protein
MSDFFDDIAGLDFEQEQPTRQLPRIWWFNGVDAKTVRTNGEFYTKLDGCESPWTVSNRFTDESGYSTPSLLWAPVYSREQWYTGTKDDTIWLTHYEKGARKYSEQLGFAAGINEPIILVTKGMVSRAIYGKGGVVEQFVKTIGAYAASQAKTTLPGWAFYIPMVAPVDKKGTPVYTETGKGSVVTLPVLNPKFGPTRDDLKALYVGKDMLELGAQIQREYKGWSEERRGNVAPDAQDAPLPPPRNTPQALEEPPILPF